MVGCLVIPMLGELFGDGGAIIAHVDRLICASRRIDALQTVSACCRPILLMLLTKPVWLVI